MKGRACNPFIHNRFAAVLLFLLLFVFTTCPAAQASDGDPLILKVGLYENEPKIFSDSAGKPAGFWPELLEYVAAEEGWVLHYVPGTWEECLERLEQGLIDIMPDVAYTEERSHLYTFNSETAHVSWSRVYTKRGADIESVLDLDNTTLAVLAESVNVTGPEGIATLIDAFDIDCTLVPTDSYENVFKMIADGEVDGGVVSRSYANRYLDTYNLISTPIIFQPASLYFAFPPDAPLTPMLIDTLDTWLLQLKADKDSVYYELLETWLGVKPLDAPVSPTWLFWILGGIALIALLHITGGFLIRRQVATRTKVLSAEIIERERTERLLRESERKFSIAFRSSPVIIAITTIKEGRYVDINNSYSRVTGYSRDELIGRRTSSIGIWASSSERDRMLLLLKQEGSINGEEFQFRMKSGEIRTWLHSAEPIIVDTEECIIGVSIDITERKKQQQLDKDENVVLSLMGQQSKLQDVLEAIIRLGERYNPGIRGSVFLADLPNGTLNVAAAPSVPPDFKAFLENGRTIGPDSGACGRAAFRKERVVVPDIAASPMYPQHDVFLAAGIRASYSQPVISSSGTLLGTIAYYGRQTGDPGADTLRTLEWSAHMAALVIERQQTSEALRENEKKYRILVENAEDIVYSLDTQGVFTYVSPTWTKLLGHDTTEIEGHSFTDFVHADDSKQALELLAAALTTNRSAADIEYRARHKNGQWCWHTSNVSKITDEAGEIVSFMGIARDITARKLAEDELKASEERYRLLAENAQDLIFRISLAPEFKFEYISPSCTDITGYTPEEHYADPSIRYRQLYPDDRGLMESLMQNPEMNTGQAVFMRWIKKNGDIIWVEQRNIYIRDDNGAIIAIEGIARDVTEKKEAEDALRASELRYRLLAEHAQDLIYRINLWPELAFDYISPSITEITGYTAADFFNEPSLAIKSFYPDDQELLLSMAASPESFFRKPVTIRWVKKNGDIIWTEQSITPVYDENGHTTALEGILRDITERKRGEEKIVHLSRILSSIRNVNQLIVREKDTRLLIQEACRTLVTTRGATCAFIILTNKEEEIIDSAEAGLGPVFESLVQQIEREGLPPCCLETTRTSTSCRTRANDLMCHSCPAGEAFPLNQNLCLLLRHQESMYGYLVVSTDSTLPLDADEQELLEEMAGDIAYGLWGIEQERLLLESEEKFKVAFRSSPEAISISRVTDGVFLEINDSYVRLTGFSRPELIDHTATELGMWDSPEQEKEMSRAIKSHQTLIRKEFVFRNKDGEPRNWILSTEYITLAGEECLLVVSTDITESKRTEIALAEEADRRSLLMEQSRDGIVILNEDGGVHEANSHFAEMLGYTPEEVRALHVWDWDEQLSAEEIEQMLQTVDEKGDHFETRHRRKDGSIFPVDISSNGAFIGGRKYVFCICRDITERTRVQEALRVSDAAFKSIHDAVIVMDKEWRVAQWNHVCEELFGIPATEAVGRFIGELMEMVEEHPGQNEERMRLLNERGWNREEQLYHTPIGYRWVDVHIQAIEDAEGNRDGWVTLAIDISERKQSETLLKTISDNSPIGTYILLEDRFHYVSQRFQDYTGYTDVEMAEMDVLDFVHPDDKASVEASATAMLSGKTGGSPFEYRIITSQGDIKWLLGTVTSIQFEGKNAVLGSSIDVTELKNLEKQVIEFEELNKLKTDLLSTVSHELRTPLATIKGYATMLVDYNDRLENEEKIESLISIDQATDRLMRLVDQLLEMSRLDAGLLKLDRTRADIARLLRQAITDARLRTPDYTFIADIPGTLPVHDVDVNRIRQVIDNLIDNATKYSPPGSDITITAHGTKKEVMVCFTDHGQGIPADELTKVFDRLYRIEQRLQPASGLGLGLSICKGLVEAHGGRIWAESDGTSGSRFIFTLPLRDISK